MNPLLASVNQRGVHRQSVQALPPAVTNNRITGCSPLKHDLTTICGDSGVAGYPAILYPLPTGVFFTVRPQFQPGTDGHSVGRTEDNLVVMIFQCSAAHGFSRLYNRVSSQCRD